MERPIQIGDIAVVIVNEREYLLGITAVHPTHIKAGDHTLVPMGNSWVVQNYPVAHSVRFKAGPPLTTHIPEVASQILLSLDYKNLMSACRTNKDFNRICQDDYFWKLKVEHDYGTMTQYKPSTITFRQQYIGLMTIKDPNQAAKAGRLDILKWLAQNNIDPNQNDANWAARNGQLEVLQWLAQTRNLYPGKDGANWAAMGGHLEVLQWLAQTRDLYPNQNDANWAARNGHLGVLKWLAQTINLYPDQDGANEAADNGHLEVLEWLAQHGIYPD